MSNSSSNNTHCVLYFFRAKRVVFYSSNIQNLWLQWRGLRHLQVHHLHLLLNLRIQFNQKRKVLLRIQKRISIPNHKISRRKTNQMVASKEALFIEELQGLKFNHFFYYPFEFCWWVFSLFACHLFLFDQIRHRWTGRFEAHLWDKGSWNNIQNKKGKQGNFTKFFSVWFFGEFFYICFFIG